MALKADATQAIYMPRTGSSSSSTLSGGPIASTGQPGLTTPMQAAEEEEEGEEVDEEGYSESQTYDGDEVETSGCASSGARTSSGPNHPPYPAETFDSVILDAPCSALGLRPRLLHASWSLPQLRALASYQRALLHTAVHALKPGGRLVYSTCTVNPAECEANVRWVLDRFKGTISLIPATPHLGGPGLCGADPLTGAWS